MILCDGNYGLGAYGMDLLHNWEPEQSSSNHLVGPMLYSCNGKQLCKEG